MHLMPFTIKHHPQPPVGGVKRKRDVMEDTASVLSTESVPLSMDDYRMQMMDSSSDLQQQVPEHAVLDDDDTDTETLRCPICLKSFMCKYGLDTHYECHNNDVAKCQICQLTLPSTRHVYIHYFVVHVDRAKLPEFANQYNRPQNGITPLTQGFHDLAFTDFSIDKFAHIAKAWCERNKRRSNSVFHNYYCKKCDHAFPSADVLRMHLEMHPEICDVTCQACDVTFASKQEFEDHVIQHSSERVIETYSKLIGTDDYDVQEVLSQQEFLLCLGLKSAKSQSEWCSNNAIERAADKYESQLVAAQPPKPVNTVQPIVIEPQPESAMMSIPTPKMAKPTLPIKPQPVLQTHPAFAGSQLYRDMISQHLIQPVKEPVEISSSDDGENAAENVDTVKPYQCVICEFAYPSLYLCESHCR